MVINKIWQTKEEDTDFRSIVWLNWSSAIFGHYFNAKYHIISSASEWAKKRVGKEMRQMKAHRFGFHFILSLSDDILKLVCVCVWLYKNSKFIHQNWTYDRYDRSISISMKMFNLDQSIDYHHQRSIYENGFHSYFLV